MTNMELHRKLQSLVGEENRVLVEILKHLREVERRMMFCEFKRGSIVEYAIKDLGYSEDQAWRRVNAMRLIKTLPQIESKIADGLLSLSNLGTAQTLFSQEAKAGAPLTLEQKNEVLEQLEGKTAKEGFAIARAHSSTPRLLKRDSIREVGENLHEMVVTIDSETLELLKRLEGLMAHKNLSKNEILKEAFGLAVHTKKPKAKRATTKLSKTEEPAAIKNADASSATSRKKSTRYIPVAIRALNFARAQGKCENCGSTYAPQNEHHVPFAKGGAHSLENLRLLCRNCNRHRAIQEYGISKIENYRV